MLALLVRSAGCEEALEHSVLNEQRVLSANSFVVVRVGADALLATGYVQGAEKEDDVTQSLKIVRVPHMGRKISPINDVRAYFELRKIVKDFNPEIVHSHTFKAGLLARLVPGKFARVHTFHGHLFEDHLDVRAEELGRPMALVADEVEMTRVAVRRLVAGAAVPEVDLPGDAGLGHPLQRAVDGGAADARVAAAHEIEQLVRTQMRLLVKEQVDDAVALARALPTGRAKARELQSSLVGGERLSAAAGRLGVRVLDREIGRAHV